MFLMPVPERPKARKGRCTIVHPHTTRAQRVEQKALAKFTKTYQDTVAKQSTMAEGSSHGQPGSYFYQMGGKTYKSLPTELLQGIRQCPHFEQMLKDTATEVVQIPVNGNFMRIVHPVAHPRAYYYIILENSPVSTDNHAVENLIDDMDKIVNHEDVSFSEPTNWLKFHGCMDVITGRVSDLVDVVNLANLASLDVTKITPCRVELV